MFISEELMKTCAAEMGVDLSEEAVEKFDFYASYLCEYNEKVNLTAITDPDEIVIKHFADSLAVIKYGKIKEDCKFADVGTGAGFPGVPLLIVCPGLKLTLFDAVNKKLEFLRNLTNELGLTSNIVHMRAEEAGKSNVYRETFDCVSARAVAQLRILSEFCLPLVKKDGMFIAMKGSISEEERENGYGAFSKLGGKLYDSVFYKIHNNDERNIILIKKVSQTSSKYPRNMSQISKKPL